MQAEEAEEAGEASESEEPSCADPAPGAAAAKKKKKKKRKAAPAASLPSFDRVKANLPWAIQPLPSRGRCAIAARDIAAGEVVLLERAVAFAPRDRFVHAVCHHCLEELPPQRVGASAFCSAACSAAAGPAHEALQALSGAIAGASASCGVDAELLRLVCAVALARDDDGEEQRLGGAAVVRGARADVDALLAPAADAVVQAACEALLARAPPAAAAALGRDAAALARLAAVVNCNAHGLGALRSADGTNSADVAAGLFPFLSMLNHSCAPTAAFAAAAPGGVMAVRALAPLRRGDELTVSYLNLYEARHARRAAAQATKGFDCACARCSAPLAQSFDRRLQGAQCRCGDVFFAEEPSAVDWACAACGKRDGGAGAAAAAAAAAELEAAMQVYRQRGHGAAEPMLQQMLQRYSNVLSPHHVTLFDARTPLMNCARARGDAAAAITHCSAVIESLQSALGPSCSAEVADFLACLGDLYGARADAAGSAPLAKALRGKARDAYARAAAARALCLGPEHPATVATAALARGDGARRRA